MFFSRPLLWDGWCLFNRFIDVPANQDVLGWDKRWPGGYMELVLYRLTRQTTFVYNGTSALLKDVDYLLMAKPVS
jgi:hypothetical protein